MGEDDEYFYVQLYGLYVGSDLEKPSLFNRTASKFFTKTMNSSFLSSIQSARARFTNEVAKVTILNDDMPGTLQWEADVVYVTPGKLSLGITRTAGTTGSISCRYSTKDSHGLAGKAYKEASD